MRSLLLLYFELILLTLRDEEAHNTALKAVDTFPDNADLQFHLANSHGKRVGIHQT